MSPDGCTDPQDGHVSEMTYSHMIFSNLLEGMSS